MTTIAKPLTDAEILSFLASIRFSVLYIGTGRHAVLFGGDELQWRRDLRHLTGEQRAELCEKVVRQMPRQGKTA
jgi:hypothetical protein